MCPRCRRRIRQGRGREEDSILRRTTQAAYRDAALDIMVGVAAEKFVKSMHLHQQLISEMPRR